MLTGRHVIVHACVQAALEVDAVRWSDYRAQDEPSVMEPLVLGVMLNDLARVAWMVFKCGGNLNDAYVAMPDIPIYFNVRGECAVDVCGCCVCVWGG